jgi:hypothetical protein
MSKLTALQLLWVSAESAVCHWRFDVFHCWALFELICCSSLYSMRRKFKTRSTEVEKPEERTLSLITFVNEVSVLRVDSTGTFEQTNWLARFPAPWRSWQKRSFFCLTRTPNCVASTRHRRWRRTSAHLRRVHTQRVLARWRRARPGPHNRARRTQRRRSTRKTTRRVVMKVIRCVSGWSATDISIALPGARAWLLWACLTKAR